MSSSRVASTLLLSLAALSARALPAAPPDPATFSIAAADPATGEVGVAVREPLLRRRHGGPVGAGGVGAVATQASANTTFGPRGLDLLAARRSRPRRRSQVLLRADDGRDRRQVGVVDGRGRLGDVHRPGCNAWAGGRSGPGYAVQGNILTGEAVVDGDGEGVPRERRASRSASGCSRRSRRRRRRRRQPRAAVGRAPRLPREGGLQRLQRPRGRRPRRRPRRPLRRALAPPRHGARQRPLEPRLDGVHREAVRGGAEVAGAGTARARSAAGDAPRGPLRPRGRSGSPPATRRGPDRGPARR